MKVCKDSLGGLDFLDDVRSTFDLKLLDIGLIYVNGIGRGRAE